jgi:hypothetical protein
MITPIVTPNPPRLRLHIYAQTQISILCHLRTDGRYEVEVCHVIPTRIGGTRECLRHARAEPCGGLKGKGRRYCVGIGREIVCSIS